MAFFALEPFGSERDDARFASIALLLANANRDKKKRSQPYELQDVQLPTPHKMQQREQGDSADLLAKVKAINAQLGGKEKPRN